MNYCEHGISYDKFCSECFLEAEWELEQRDTIPSPPPEGCAGELDEGDE